VAALRHVCANCFRAARPAGNVIAEHACQKYSGRVGRSAAAKALDEQAVHLAVIAHIRHAETGYDALLAQGCERSEARTQCMMLLLGSWLGGKQSDQTNEQVTCGTRSRL